MKNAADFQEDSEFQILFSLILQNTLKTFTRILKTELSLITTAF